MTWVQGDGLSPEAPRFLALPLPGQGFAEGPEPVGRSPQREPLARRGLRLSPVARCERPGREREQEASALARRGPIAVEVGGDAATGAGERFGVLRGRLQMDLPGGRELDAGVVVRVDRSGACALSGSGA